ncbi:hypothetical protein UPYG_G00032910 [Umbra pygmaea]|uniref:Transcriptional protein SWT1 n=1 Tax=Umbra pygmaea TaxID=75934 RepID=A0ABD0XQ44_UMBPY
MSKKSRKKKKQKRKLSSSSSEENQSSQEREASKKRSHNEGKQHDNSFKEDKMGKEKGASSGNNPAGNSHRKNREIKKAVYRLEKASTSHVSEGETTYPPDTNYHESSRKSETMAVTSGGKTVDRGSTKRVNSENTNKTQSQSREKNQSPQTCSSRSLSHFTSGNSPAENSHRKDREYKIAVYELEKASTSHCSEGKTTYPPDTIYHESSRKSGTMAVTSGGKTVDRGSTKRVSSENTNKIQFQSREKNPSPQTCSSRSLSQKNPSLKALSSPKTPRLTSSPLKEQMRMLVKRSYKPEEKPDTITDNTTEMKLSHGPQLSKPLSQDLKDKRMKVVSRRYEAREVLKAQRDQSDEKPSSLFSDNTTRQSYTTSKTTTSEKMLNIPRPTTNRPTTQKQVYVHTLSKTSPISKFTFAKVEIPASKPLLHVAFKIPKKRKYVLPPVKSVFWGEDQEDSKPIKTSAKVDVADSHKPKTVSKLLTSQIVSKSLASKHSRSAVDRTQHHRSDLVSESSEILKEESVVPVQPSSPGMTFSCDRPVPTEDYAEVYDNDQEMLLVEELHLARSERRLELNVVKSYGELTCMDIDSPEESATLSKEDDRQQELIIVMDTNILLSHLDFVKKMKSHGLGALGRPTVLVPWVVLQELDALKNCKRFSSSVAHLATPAVHYIYTCLKTQEPGLWGQSMQQASQSSYGLNAENNDDRVLQCCLQYQSLYTEGAVILCTNDKNLCSKAILSGVKALSKADLVKEVDQLKSTGGHNLTPLHAQTPVRSPSQTQQIPFTPEQHHKEPGMRDGGKNQGTMEGKKDAKKAQELSICVSLLEDILKDVLSQVMEVEMKDAFEELWTEIIYVKPPWSLRDVLLCFKKHWIAVFGNIVPRKMQDSVKNLHNFFISGKSLEHNSTVFAIHEASNLLQAFGCRSDYGGCVRPALSSLKTLLQRLHPQPEKPSEEAHTSDGDTPMAELEEERPETPPQVSHQEMWVLFETVWNKVCQVSSAVFAALRFDPGAMETGQLTEAPHSRMPSPVCINCPVLPDNCCSSLPGFCQQTAV